MSKRKTSRSQRVILLVLECCFCYLKYPYRTSDETWQKICPGCGHEQYKCLSAVCDYDD